MAKGLSVGYETWPPNDWHHAFVIGWFNIDGDCFVPHCIMGSRDQWEFPPFFWPHWQSLCTALTAELCKGTVKESSQSRATARYRQSRVGVTQSIHSVRLFSFFSELSMYWVTIQYHIYIGKCHRSLAAVTSVKYQCDWKDIADASAKSEISFAENETLVTPSMASSHVKCCREVSNKALFWRQVIIKYKTYTIGSSHWLLFMINRGIEDGSTTPQTSK